MDISMKTSTATEKIKTFETFFKQGKYLKKHSNFIKKMYLELITIIKEQKITV